MTTSATTSSATSIASQDTELREMRRTVAGFLDRHADPARVRQAMAGEPGYDPVLWRRGVDELGLGALLVPARCGGLGLDFTAAAAVLEEFGRRLVPSPLPATLVATAVLDACGTPAADALLARIAEDGVSVAVAVAEPEAGWTTGSTATTATADGERWVLRGAKHHVVHGAAVDVLLVVARADAGIGLYAVPADAPGVLRSSRVALDQTRRLAEIDLHEADAVQVSAGPDAVDLLTDLMLTALAVESAAAAKACLAGAVEYLEVRHQFGRPLGSFQALKHRCADLAVTVEGALSTAWYAVRAAAAGSEELHLVAPLARVVCADALMQAAAESVQLHGGIGFTFEHDAHLYLKRGKANQLLFGSGPELRRRVGRLAGLQP
ncbi:acyl-CoA dehydrogenase family protein [Pseudonocardia nigra]|uniref:acyl-CoA dehydrogenase family protein n=1 Tax=Pseudonocardia nigra TaxID=1921578 RepID=UPI001C5FAD37|nr:acyl-CoA dehydrogenase family protein [Pseudonocardia nigra]